MNINECIRQGLLKKIEKDDKKAVRSIGISKMKLSKASKLLDNGFVEDSVINSYAAMFHASRAILFMDGFKEKSHYAIYVYLREKYINKIECHPNGPNSQTELCQQKQIEGTPTWTIEQNGKEVKRHPGFLTLDELREFAGCS